MIRRWVYPWFWLNYMTLQNFVCLWISSEGSWLTIYDIMVVSNLFLFFVFIFIQALTKKNRFYCFSTLSTVFGATLNFVKLSLILFTANSCRLSFQAWLFDELVTTDGCIEWLVTFSPVLCRTRSVTLAWLSFYFSQCFNCYHKTYRVAFSNSILFVMNLSLAKYGVEHNLDVVFFVQFGSCNLNECNTTIMDVACGLRRGMILVEFMVFINAGASPA